MPPRRNRRSKLANKARKRFGRKGAKTLVKVVRQVAKQEALKVQETKYAADQDNTVVNAAVPALPATPANFGRCLMEVGQGLGDFQRIGDNITPMRARTTFTYWFNCNQSANSHTQDVVVHLLILTAKGFDSSSAQAQIPLNRLLRNGAGGFVDPNGSQQSNLINRNFMPINTDLYTVHKKIQFRMRKGPGAPNSAGGAIAPTGVPHAEDFKVINYTWKPPKLGYNTNGASLPEKHNPLYITWFTNVDGTANDSNLIWHGVRREIFYKDA